jgi:hypothetical protein
MSKIITISLLVCLTLLVIPIGCAPTSLGEETEATQMPETDLMARIEAPSVLPTGEAVKLSFTLTNNTDTSLYVLKWYTPLEGIAGEIFRVERDGQAVPYQGILATRATPSTEDYVRLEPGASASAEVNLAPAYDFSQAGEYTIAFISPRISHVARTEAEMATSLDELGPVEIPANEVTVEVRDSAGSSFQTSPTLPPELNIEEYALKDGPELEPLIFVPEEGTQEEILSKHQAQRATSTRTPCQPECEASLGGHSLTATTSITDTPGGQRVVAEVFEDGNVVHTIPLGDPCAIPPLWGLWAYEGHWVLEAAYVKARRQDGAIYCDPVGQIIWAGESLNEQHGYQESFGFQLMNGKPFYFFKRGERLGVSYDGHKVPLGYTHIFHYQCCSGSALNLRSSRSMVAFFAQRDRERYYVEIGVFE